MSRMQDSFYVTGGTLGHDVPCYVPRQADHNLFDGLKQGEFCYVLTSRQMGKSSLMVRTATRLRAEGVSVAVLDLTAIGVNVTPEQWYDGLLARVARFPNSPEPPAADETITETHRQMARLHYARGNVLELLANGNIRNDAAGMYDEAQNAHTRAGDLNPEDARFPLAVARTLRRRATRWPSEPRSRQDLQQALQLSDEAAGLDPDLAEIYNQRGEIYLSLDRIAEARLQFHEAVQRGRRGGHELNLYRYYCNESNSHTRRPATEDDHRKALEAANRAIALQPDGVAEGRYFRGLALWGLEQTTSALEAFDETLAIEPKHVGALLARCQIVFETQQPPPTAEQLGRAVRDADMAVRLVDETATTNHDRAKAYYVHSLAWLRRHLDNKSERSLVNCQDDLIKSIGFSPEYAQPAKKVFDYAESFPWTDDKLREESQRLRGQFNSLMDR